MNTKSRKTCYLLLSFCIIASMVGFSNSAMAQTSGNGVIPDNSFGTNPNCAAIGLDGNHFEFKFDSSGGDAPLQSSTVTVYGNETITLTLNADGKSFSWSSTFGIDAVIVKGGPNANVYFYDPESTGDSGLISPNNASGAPAAISHISFCYDYELTVTKTANPVFTRTYDWDIEKTADPTSLDFFEGEPSKEVDYSVTVTKGAGVDSDFSVSGTVTIANNSPLSAVIASIDDVLEGYGDVSLNCNVSFPYTLAAGQSLVCTYNAPLDGPGDGVLTNEVIVTTSGSVGGGSASADADFNNANPTTVVNDTVNIEDDFDNDGSIDKQWSTSTTDTFTYTREFDCGDAGTKVNTATIVETDQSDSASVEIVCYALTVSKTAIPQFTREWDWEIVKSVDQDLFELFKGESANPLYTVAVTKLEPVDKDFSVSGVISITNPHPLRSIEVDISDYVTDGNSDSSVINQNITVAPDSTENIPYDLSWGNFATDNTYTNVAKVTTQYNLLYTATADFTFDTPTTLVNDTVTVEDNFNNGGPEELGELSESFTYEPYSRTILCGEGCFDEDGCEYPNIASVIGDNDEVLDDDTVVVTVKCYDISVVKTADPTFVRTWNWTIDKSVDEKEFHLFNGQTATAYYTIDVTKVGYTDSDFEVSGEITISNPHPERSITVTISDVIDGGPSVTVDCPTLEVPAGESVVCTYSGVTSDDFETGVTFTNIATVSTEYESYEATADFEFTTPTSVVNDSVTVEDIFEDGDLETFGPTSESTTYQTSQDLDCGDGCENGCTYDNIASLYGDDELLGSDQESVLVKCYDLVVTKTATPTLTRTYGWTIEKSVSNSVIELIQGQSETVTYTVKVTKDEGTDSEFEVSGTVMVENPHPTQDITISLSDIILDGGPVVNLVCDDEPIVVPAGGSVKCTYTGVTWDGFNTNDTFTNEVTVTTNYKVYPPATATFAFNDSDADLVVKKVNDTINVTDTNVVDPLGSVSDDETFTYDRTFDCGNEGENPNVATIVETGQSDGATVTVTCYELTVDAAGIDPLGISYTLDKEVDVDEWHLLCGDTATSVYTIKVTKNVDTEVDVFNFTYEVQNPSPFEFTINTITLNVDGFTPINITPCDGGVVPANGFYLCDFSETLTGAQDGYSFSISATATGISIPDANGFLDIEENTVSEPLFVFDDQLNDTFEFDSSSDDFVETNVNGSGYITFGYEKTFNCDACVESESTVVNTAFLRDADDENLAQASAEVDIHCYALTLTKTAEASFDRTYVWDITKTGDELITLIEGQEYNDPINYSVTVTMVDEVDSKYVVTGDITLDVSGIPEGLLEGRNFSVVDNLCEINVDVTPDSDNDFAWTYLYTSETVPECDTNTATLNYNTIDFDIDGGEVSGAKAIEATADVDPVITELYECIDVTDTLAGDLGTVCEDESPKTFKYTIPFDAANYPECGVYYIDNTASFVTNDTGTTGSDTHQVKIDITCVPTGCTLTIGYWKTHAFQGPAPYDEAWENLKPYLEELLGEDYSDYEFSEEIPFYHSGLSYFEIFWTPPKGNPYYNLAHQYIGALLNALNGAQIENIDCFGDHTIEEALAIAHELFTNCSPECLEKQTGKPQTGKPQTGKPNNANGKKTIVIGQVEEEPEADPCELCNDYAGSFNTSAHDLAKYLASMFANYNEGNCSVPHCDEDSSSRD